MKALIQRVSKASVDVAGERVGKIDKGLLILLCAEQGDETSDVEWLSKKCTELRIFEDDARKMNRSLLEVSGQALVVSQFTLAADCRKGRRLSFEHAEKPEKAQQRCDLFCNLLRESGVLVETGRFGAMMQVSLTNDGPVTILLDSRER